MHDEPIMHDDATEALDLRVVNALEVQPGIEIAADFAARVAAKVPARRKVLAQARELRTTRYGYWMLGICMVVLLVAMLAFAPRAVASSALWVGIEWTMCAQFVLLALWFGWLRNRSQ
jgi:hypothetical protein